MARTGTPRWGMRKPVSTADAAETESEHMTVTIQIDGKPQTYELPPEVVQALQAIADRHGLTFEQVFAQAVVNQNTLEDELGSDGELLVKKGDKLLQFEYA